MVDVRGYGAAKVRGGQEGGRGGREGRRGGGAASREVSLPGAKRGVRHIKQGAFTRRKTGVRHIKQGAFTRRKTGVRHIKQAGCVDQAQNGGAPRHVDTADPADE